MPNKIERYKGHITHEGQKRTYCEITVRQKCECGEIMTHSYEDHYFNYPVDGEVLSISFYCSSCESEWLVPANIQFFGIVLDVHHNKMTKDDG